MRKIRTTTSIFVIGLMTAVGLSAQDPGDTESTVEKELPPGHPQISTPPSATFTLPPVAPGSGTGESGLVWEVPEGWITETPANSMRKAQYRVPGEAGDGQCVVFYFGPGQGGPAQANAERWAGQFQPADGTPPLEAMKTETLDVGGLRVLLVETAGTYTSRPMMQGAPETREGHMLLGAIAEGSDANWFFKLTGPEATLAPQRDAFRRMMASLKTGG